MRVTITLETLTGHNTGPGVGAARPFLWPVFFKVDEFTLKSVICDMRGRGEDAGITDFLAPEEWCRENNWIMRRSWLHGTDGSHGNLPEMNDGDTTDIPAHLGRWETTLEFQQMDNLNNAQDLLVGCIVVLLEEDNIPSDEDIREYYHTFLGDVRERIVRLVERTIRNAADHAGTPTGFPRAYLWRRDESKHVMYRGNDGHIHEMNWKRGRDGSNWRHHDLTQTMRARAAQADPTGDSWAYAWRDQHVFYQGNDTLIRELHYSQDRDENRWREKVIRLFSYDLTDLPETPVAAGRIIAYPWDDNDSQHVFYRSADGHIHELNWKRRQIRRGAERPIWRHLDLTDETGAVLAAGDPSGYIWADDESHRIFYRGEDNHIHELRKSRGSDWVHLDITERAEAPDAAGNVSAYVWRDNETQHVFYRGVDGRIHELHWARGRRGSNWRHTNVSEAAGGAPEASGDPSAYVWQDDESQHVFYRGTDNHIHELHWKSGRKGPNWRHADLTAAIDAPDAAAGPSAFDWEDEESQHVFYRDVNGHIRELNYKRSRERPRWRDFDITEEAGLGEGDGGDDRDNLNPANLEAEITRTIDEKLPDFFMFDDLIGVGVWFWKILDLRDAIDPSSGRYTERFGRRWSQSSGARRGLFPDDWEINGSVRVVAARR